MDRDLGLVLGHCQLLEGAVWWVGAERRLRRCQGWRLMKGIGASVWGSSSSCHAHVHF